MHALSLYEYIRITRGSLAPAHDFLPALHLGVGDQAAVEGFELTEPKSGRQLSLQIGWNDGLQQRGNHHRNALPLFGGIRQLIRVSRTPDWKTPFLESLN